MTKKYTKINNEIEKFLYYQFKSKKLLHLMSQQNKNEY